jgi:hypothetical protein
LAATEAQALSSASARRGVVAALKQRLALASYLVALAPAIVMAVAQPVWSRVDEPQHADVLVQYAHGVYPVEARTLVRPETQRLMEQTGVFSGDLPGRWPRPHFDPAGPPPASAQGGYPRELWMSRHVWQYSYEAMQPPLYYLVAAPVWKLASGAGGTIGAVFAVRLLDALVAALLAPLSFFLARRLWPAAGLALAAAALAASVPGFVLNATQVTNDGLAAVLGALAVLLALRGAQDGWTGRLAAVVGLVFGLAVVTKLTAAGLGPALALALLYGRFRVRHALLAGGVAAACVAPWLLVNEVVYHGLTPAVAAHDLSAIAPALTPAFLLQSALHAFVTFWTGDPVFALPFAQAFALLAALLMAFSLAGLVRLTRRQGASRPALAVLAVAVAGEVAVALVAPEAARAAFLAPGRYAYPALAPALVLLAAGLWSEFKDRRLAWALGGGLTTMGAAMLALYAAGLPAMPPLGPGQPRSAALPASSAGQFDGVNIAIDQVAPDPRGAWIHVRYSNSGGDAEWTPVPVVSAGRAVVGLGDYPASTPLPGWLPAQSSGAGWIRLDLETGAPRNVKIRFLDIATDGYTRVGSVILDLNLP